MLEYGREIKIYYDNKVNIVKKQIEHIQGVNALEKCVNSQNNEISELSAFLLKEFITKEEDNKLNN